ncbi:conjugal transfer protein [Paenibacillus sp. USHLN196]|uniref:conjugal transfer protein n=1 Tax=Paenibacillus sp. USHLN196 TaxID=3081291 RepID=UPI00301A2C78
MAKSLAKRKAADDAPQQEKVSVWEKIKRFFRNLQKPKVEERKAYRPRGYRTRKFGTIVFWIMFGFVFLVFFFSTLNPSKQEDVNAAAVEQTPTLNPATTTTAVQYAENFAKEYFTWKPGSEALAKRQERLAPYLAEGIDPHAGLEPTSLKTTSVLLSTEIANIEEKGDNKAYVTLKVYQKLGIPKEVETTDKKTKKKTTTTKYEPKEVSKFFVVPVAYAQNYGIYDLPKYTYINPQTTVVASDPKNGLQDVAESEVKQNIRNFLDTFFGSYATDPADKLAYLLEDKDHPSGLNKRMNFVNVKNSQIYQGETPETYIVFATVVLEDPVSEDRFVTNYRLDITQKDGRYVVSKIDQQ